MRGVSAGCGVVVVTMVVVMALMLALAQAPSARATGFPAARLLTRHGHVGRWTGVAGATSRHVLALRLRSRVSRRLTTPAFGSVQVRIRVRRCASTADLGVAVDGRWTRLTGGTRRWAVLSAPISGRAGRHDLEIAGPTSSRGCPAVVLVDRVAFGAPARPSRAVAPPAAPPASAPPTPVGPATPPPAGPSPAASLLADTRTPSLGRGPVATGSAVSLSHIADARYRDTFLSNFNSLTPENEMKMERLQPHRGRFDFREADAMVAFAQAHGKQIHGHTLIWHGQDPYWLTHGHFSRTELIDIMRTHIQTVMRHFQGAVGEWDVVNEPFAPDGSLRSSLWSRGIGPDYIELALRFAREADPSARLFINEIGADTANAKSNALLALVTRLRVTGVPLDGVGFQMHTELGDAPGETALADNLARFETLGLREQITEMDVATNGSAASPEARASGQARAFGDAATACAHVAACERFTVWGVTDLYSWRGAAAAPLLFDSDYAAKPALGAVHRGLATRP